MGPSSGRWLLGVAVLLAGVALGACTRFGFTRHLDGAAVDTADTVAADTADAVAFDGGRPDSRLDTHALPDLGVLATFSRSVSAEANIYGAGHVQPPAPAGGGAGQLPVEVVLPAGGERVVRLTSVSGTILFFPVDTATSADGKPEAGWPPAPSWDGLSGFITQDLAPGLVGVFLDDTEPKDPPPSELEVGDCTFAELSPALRQIFVLGDGLTGTGSGAVQLFHVPAGATRLFLGVVDRLYDGSLPGYYQDNSGSFQVDGDLLGH